MFVVISLLYHSWLVVGPLSKAGVDPEGALMEGGKQSSISSWHNLWAMAGSNTFILSQQT